MRTLTALVATAAGAILVAKADIPEKKECRAPGACSADEHAELEGELTKVELLQQKKGLKVMDSYHNDSYHNDSYHNDSYHNDSYHNDHDSYYYYYYYYYQDPVDLEHKTAKSWLRSVYEGNLSRMPHDEFVARFLPAASFKRKTGTATGSTADSLFGFSVSINSDGSKVAVGAPGEDTEKGSVYMFDGSGTQIAKLTAEDSADGDGFGMSVDISSSGSRVIVGAPWKDDSGLGALGCAYLFDGSGAQIAKLTAADHAAFGFSVAISSDGSKVAVGALIGADFFSPGAVYLFDGSGTEIAKLTAEDASVDDFFGFSLAINSDGSKVAVGAVMHGGQATVSGAVYMFDGSGTQIAKLTAEDGAAYDWFGCSVAMSSDGSKVAVGAPFADSEGYYHYYYDSGAVYLFDSGTQVGKAFSEGPAAFDYFGHALSISSDGLSGVVGDFLDDEKGWGSGSIYLVDGSGPRKLSPADGAEEDYFGWSLALSSDGSRVAVSSPRDDDTGSDTGSVYLFDSAGTQLAKLTATTTDSRVFPSQVQVPRPPRHGSAVATTWYHH